MGRGPVPAVRRRVGQLRVGRGAQLAAEPAEDGRRGVRRDRGPRGRRAGDRVRGRRHRRGRQDVAGRDGEQRAPRRGDQEASVRRAQRQAERERRPAVGGPRARHRRFPDRLIAHRQSRRRTVTAVSSWTTRSRVF